MSFFNPRHAAMRLKKAYRTITAFCEILQSVLAKAWKAWPHATCCLRIYFLTHDDLLFLQGKPETQIVGFLVGISI